ncbi:DUF4174 domain-containing protein [Aliishimia ponticola]|uniref:DUF4174 domain-containing protein n=1 Tax=Aliishimia ponticola TaxID=2499833 RepID=A0A4S4N9F5_9RHOB|nr:DUF4174 domain-containing protein [Aliishimia ponticola]THH35799.1 DUF4174 domain-containing protein [Aliishimia ponticola]
MLRTSLLSLVFTALFASASSAADGEKTDPDALFQTEYAGDLSEFVWKKRPVIVFADSEFDPAFSEQMEMLRTRPEALMSRDVVVLTDTDPSNLSAMRKKLRPNGFALVIMSKEGRVQLRKPAPWDVREITRSIDKMPIRQLEIREEKERARQ